MTDLEKDVLKAKEMGISYGQFKALSFDPSQEKRNRRRKTEPSQRKKRYDDHRVFKLWQAGMSDAEIASDIGVSRTIIQRWRDTMELPSTKKSAVDTKKYRLDKLKDGTVVCIKED